MATPTQATDATENDKNLPMVTSSVSVYSGGGERSLYTTIATTNGMTLDKQESLLKQLGKGNPCDENHRNETAESESLNIQAPPTTRPQIVRHEGSQDPMATPEARSVIEMGYSRTAVELAIHEYNGKNPTKGAQSNNAGDLVQKLVGRQERGEEIQQDLPSEELGATGSSQQAAVSGARPKETQKCKECHSNDSCMMLVPCNHCCLCVGCARKVIRCPVCRRRVELSVRSFGASPSSEENNDKAN